MAARCKHGIDAQYCASCERAADERMQLPLAETALRSHAKDGDPIVVLGEPGSDGRVRVFQAYRSVWRIYPVCLVAHEDVKEVWSPADSQRTRVLRDLRSRIPRGLRPAG
jgi:hypothetical protein